MLHPLVFGILIFVFAVLLASSSCAAQAEGERDAADIVPILMGIIVLILVTTAAGWYFGRPVHRIPFLIGIAAFSAACGIGLGLSPQATFAALIPALAAVFGGTLVCAVSAKPPTDTVMSYGSAASGIPLLLGAYLGNSITMGDWYADTSRLVSALLSVVFAVAVAAWVGRKTKNTPLCLGSAAFGATVGLTTGLSPYPVVAYVAPAALALFVGAASYAFTAKKEQRRNIGGILTCFGLLLVIGLFLGGIMRLELGWAPAPRMVFAFAALMLTIMALGSVAGRSGGDVLSGLGFAALGGGVGLAIGLSSSPIVHVVIPALLTMFFGLTIYIVAADREDRTVHIHLLGVFAVFVLLGSFVGYSLRQEELCKQLELLRSRLEELEERPESLDPETQAFVEEAREAVAVAEQQAARSLWVEGSATASAILIDVRNTLDGTLRVVERVDERLLYEGTPSPGTPLRLSGESLEISWAVSSGRDAISLTVWDRMVEHDEVWMVVGPGESIATESAEVRNGRFIVVHP